MKAAASFRACNDCVCWALRRTSRAVTKHYEAAFRGTGLRATQFAVLAVLVQTGPMKLTELADFLGLERTSLTRHLRPLEQRGLVGEATGDDQRVRRIRITKKGEATARAAMGAWSRAQATVGKVLRGTGIGKLLSPRSG